MKQLTARQTHILQWIEAANTPLGNAAIKALMAPLYGPVSRITIVRDLEVLLTQNLIKKQGQGRNLCYVPHESTRLLRNIDPNRYFEQPDEDRAHFQRFNFDIFNTFSNLFTPKELKKLQTLTHQYITTKNEMSPTLLHKEMERLSIELSWKSSQIEGNTYSLLDTEALIKDNREAPGHTKAEATMILNHKEALAYCFSHPNRFKSPSVRAIEDIHQLLVNHLEVDFGIRKRLVRIIGTAFLPLDNAQQIKESLEQTLTLIDRYSDPFHKALITIALISYIQPFMDGNKRTARIAGNAILYAHGACPLSYRSVDPVDYKKAMLLFYEQNSLAYFKTLFISQYEFSVQTYFSGK